MKTKPKYSISDKAWLMDMNRACEKIICGVFPFSKVYRVLPRGEVADEGMTHEDFNTWKMMPEENRKISFRVDSWQYLVKSNITDAHLLCSMLSEKAPGEVLNHFFNLIPENKLFDSKDELLKSL